MIMNGFNLFSSNLGYEMYDSLTVTGVEYYKDEAFLKNSPVYKMCFVTFGDGEVEHLGEIIFFTVGDVLIIPPTCSARIVGKSFEIISVDVKGREMDIYSKELGFARSIKKVSGLSDNVSMWKRLDASQNVLHRNIRAKGVILCAISEMYDTVGCNDGDETETVAARIKAYIDQSFTVCDLSLKMIGNALTYHPNYVSSIFKNKFGINISKYVNIVRIRHSRFLIDMGEHSVKRLAELSGFSDEEYFSSVFKKHVGETPREYIKRNQKYGSVM